MSNEEYSNLIDFLSGKFARIDARFDGIDERFEGIDKRFEGIDARFEVMDQRIARLEVSFEEFRHDMRAVTALLEGNAELLRQNGRRLDRIERLIA